eukprot:gene27525-33247_t
MSLASSASTEGASEIPPALLLQSQQLKQFRSQEADHLLDQAEQRLKSIKQQLKTLEVKEKKLLATDNQQKDKDWTQIYQKADTWTALEAYQDKETKEKENIESLLAKQDQLGHYHDHTKEREFFQLDEEDKIRKMEEQKIMGNYYYKEGNLARACERYQVAIAYYEYIFAPSAERQAQVDDLRFQCLCNLALCQIKLKQYREAIDSCGRVLQEQPEHVKALFRRAQAHRLLDEYERAKEDLAKALAKSPKDKAIKDELLLLQEAMRAGRQAEESFAQNVLHIHNSNGSHSSEPRKNCEDPVPACFDTEKLLEPVKPLCLQNYELHMSQAVVSEVGGR